VRQDSDQEKLLALGI